MATLSDKRPQGWWRRLIGKAGKSLAALATAFTFITATGQKLEVPLIVLLIVSTLALAFYWHLIESITEYFTELKQDVKIIKDAIVKRGKQR